MCGFPSLPKATGLAVVVLNLCVCFATTQPPGRSERRSHIEIRGIYGGVPTQIFDRGSSLDDYGVNAIWIGSGSVKRELVESLKARCKGLKVFAEFKLSPDRLHVEDAHQCWKAALTLRRWRRTLRTTSVVWVKKPM